MQNFFNPHHQQQLLQRFEQLSPAHTRKWGTLSAEEMLWHLRCQLELALGHRHRVTDVQSFLRLPPVRWLALYAILWPKSSPTAPEMNVRKVKPEVKDFTTELELLRQRMHEVQTVDVLGPHPLFGSMKKKMWGRLIWKHMDHHLQQFGV